MGHSEICIGSDVTTGCGQLEPYKVENPFTPRRGDFVAKMIAMFPGDDEGQSSYHSIFHSGTGLCLAQRLYETGGRIDCRTFDHKTRVLLSSSERDHPDPSPPRTRANTT